MKIKPMIGEYEVPGLERIGATERRRLREIPVPGLGGSYHQDLGAHPLTLRLEGSLQGDDNRDGFLEKVRAMFADGKPVDFVADIVTATSIEKMIVAGLDVEESSEVPDTFRYAISLLQFTEPPPDPAPENPADAIAAEADLLTGVLEIPDLLGAPDFGDPTPPLKATLDEFKGVMDGLSGLGEAASALFGAP
jgi:hypothetical protein